MQTFRLSLITFLAVVSLVGCGSIQPLQGPIFGARETRALTINDLATVMDVRPVVIQADKTNTGAYAGGAVGAALGGMAGSKASKKSKTGATVLGATVGGVAGAVVGDAVATEMAKTQGVEVVVKRYDGKIQSVIQPVNSAEQFQPGQVVRLMQAPGGWHVSPL